MGEVRELQDAISKIRNLPRVPKVEIKVASFGTLLEAIERAGIPLRFDPHWNFAGTFMGARVIESHLIPPGFAAVIVDDEVTQVLDLRAKEETR